MSRAGSQVLILLGDGYLPVTRVAVQRGEKLGVSHGVQTVIHPWERIRITHRSIGQLTVVDATACGSIRLRHKNNRTGLLAGAWYNHVQLKHLFHLLADEWSGSGTHAVWMEPHGFGTRL